MDLLVHLSALLSPQESFQRLYKRQYSVFWLQKESEVHVQLISGLLFVSPL